MKKNRMNQKGFTLIELLAVIVILAILMTLAVTSMQRYINNAKKDTYITTAQQFLSSVRLGVTNGEYETPDIGECTVVAVSDIETTSEVKNSPYSQAYKDDKSYVVVYNSASAGSETKLEYYMAMDDKLDNGFPLTKESGLNNKIVFARNSTSGNAITSVTKAAVEATNGVSLTLGDSGTNSGTCKVTNYYGK